MKKKKREQALFLIQTRIPLRYLFKNPFFFTILLPLTILNVLSISNSSSFLLLMLLFGDNPKFLRFCCLILESIISFLSSDIGSGGLAALSRSIAFILIKCSLLSLSDNFISSCAFGNAQSSDSPSCSIRTLRRLVCSVYSSSPFLRRNFFLSFSSLFRMACDLLCLLILSSVYLLPVLDLLFLLTQLLNIFQKEFHVQSLGLWG